MIETTVESIRISLVTQSRVVILKEVDGERHLPIWIGTYEAEAIGLELQGTVPTRPLPYDLFKNLATELGATIDHILIAELNEQIYFAKIIVNVGERTIEVDSRPSDAIAIALRMGAKIMVDETIMSEVGVSIDDDEDQDISLQSAKPSRPVPPAAETTEVSGAKSADDEQLSVFRDFINSLDLDDFDKKRSG